MTFVVNPTCAQHRYTTPTIYLGVPLRVGAHASCGPMNIVNVICCQCCSCARSLRNPNSILATSSAGRRSSFTSIGEKCKWNPLSIRAVVPNHCAPPTVYWRPSLRVGVRALYGAVKCINLRCCQFGVCLESLGNRQLVLMAYNKTKMPTGCVAILAFVSNRCATRTLHWRPPPRLGARASRGCMKFVNGNCCRLRSSTKSLHNPNVTLATSSAGRCPYFM